MQANAERAGRKHLFLFPAWLSGLWELARRKDGAKGNCKTKCQLSGYYRLYRLLGWCFSLTFKQSGKNPHSTFGRTSMPLNTMSQGTVEELSGLLVTSCSDFLLPLHSRVDLMSCLLGLLHPPHCFVPQDPILIPSVSPSTTSLVMLRVMERSHHSTGTADVIVVKVYQL